jgi:hypothetical protein
VVEPLDMDNVPPGIPKDNLDTAVELLYLHFVKLWKTGMVPSDWDKGLLVKLPNKGNFADFINWTAVIVLSVPSKVL